MYVRGVREESLCNSHVGMRSYRVRVADFDSDFLGDCVLAWTRVLQYGERVALGAQNSPNDG